MQQQLLLSKALLPPTVVSLVLFATKVIKVNEHNTIFTVATVVATYTLDVSVIIIDAASIVNSNHYHYICL